MSRINTVALLLVAAALTFAPATVLGVPNLISYQGQLNDQAGVPVNGTVSFVFSIYDVPDGGTALWTEGQTLPVSNGVFSVQLGAVQALSSSVFGADTLFLGIKVGADSEMTPRQRLTTNAYSYRAELGVVPIGGIVAWNKSMSGTPALPAGWAECNGQVLADAASPYNGQTLPNLNGQSRVLYGGASSGTTREEDYVPPHVHGYGSLKAYTNYGEANGADGTRILSGGSANGQIFGNTASTQSGTPLGGFQVVWIIRVR